MQKMPGWLSKMARIAVRFACLPKNRNAFVYFQTLANRVPRPDISVPYVEHYGQCGEDLIVESFIAARAFSEGLDPSALRYLEIGGNHPFATSATFLLHAHLEMTRVIVEANGRLIAALRKGRPRDTIVHAAVIDSDEETVLLSVSRLNELSSLDPKFVLSGIGGSVGQARTERVPAIRINQIIERHLGAAPCFMSIDVEGLDLRLLRDFDFSRYRPWFIQVEPSDDYLPGNSATICKFMCSVGYRLIAKTKVNMIFGEL
jgi:FkbM family methyltransferase